MVTITPTTGVQGMPAGTKEAGQRVDFKATQFDVAIETKGYRLAWERACICPCAPIDDQTDHADPNCLLCKGIGWLYFGRPTTYYDTDAIGTLTDVQKAIVERNNAWVIRGIMSRFEVTDQPYEKFGKWVSGSSTVTVRAENKLGYYDRITNLDSEIVYSQFLDAGNPVQNLELRYKATAVNLLRTEDTIFAANVDFTLENGDIKWLKPTETAPTAGSKLAIHYHCHPSWIVIDYPHVLRMTSVKYKTASPTTPLGDPRPLPIQASVKYDFMVT